MPIKITKGKHITFGEKEYNSIRKDGENYVLDLVSSEAQLSDEQVKDLFARLEKGQSKPIICAHFHISEYTFTQICRKHFNSNRITEIRTKLKEEKIRNEIAKK